MRVCVCVCVFVWSMGACVRVCVFSCASTHIHTCVYTGVKVIFDGVMFRIHHGRMFGINKMWSNIVPFMAQAVRSLGGMMSEYCVYHY